MGVSRNKKIIVIFSLLIVSLFCIQFLRLPYGIPSTDEQLYIVFPYRFIQGDLILIDDWNSAQLIGFITMPIIKLFSILNNGSIEGIAYFFRMCYVILMTTTVIFIFSVSKKSYLLIASLIIFYMSCPFNIMSLSYNTLSIVFMLLSLFILYRFSRNGWWFLSGIFYSLSVLCVPYLAILFILLVFFLVFQVISKNKKINIKLILFFCLGVFTMFVLFLCFMMKGNIYDIFYGIKIILNDPSHQSNLIMNTVEYLYQFIRFTNIFLVVWISLVIRVLILRRNNKDTTHCLKIAIVNCTLYIVCCFVLYNVAAYRYLFMNYTFMISLLGFLAYICGQKKDQRLLYIYLLSFSLSFFLNLQSNVSTSPMTTGLLVTNVFSILLLEQCFDSRQFRKLLTVFFFVSICYGVSSKFYIYDYNKEYQPTMRIQEGKYKGLLASSEEYNEVRAWENESRELNKLIQNINSTIFLSDYSPLKYVDLNARIGTFSTYVYISDVSERNELYGKYLEFIDDDIEFVYIPKSGSIDIPVISAMVETKYKIEYESKLGKLYKSNDN